MGAPATYLMTEPLWEDGNVGLWRGQSSDGAKVLVRVPISESPASTSLRQIEHEYALCGDLDAEWAILPLALIQLEKRTALVLEGGSYEPLVRWVKKPMDLARFFNIAINLATAIGRVHDRGLIHKDIKPANVLINRITDTVRLTGFGIASRLLREHQSAEPLEVLSGTFAYMAPEQTGRMNRSVDLRSDLYSFGVTCYEMLTGTLPFKADDPMEWVHCHIARLPEPPIDRVPGIPRVLSDIVMKLMAKMAEDRYQGAAGVVADLKHCFAEWISAGDIKPFTLGAKDFSGRLLVPEKLYGREQETRILLTTFERVANEGRPRMTLVTGYSGIGKSSLVNELHKAVVGTRGWFIEGKFDQYKRDIPYATLAQAFRMLIRDILSRGAEELESWRQAVQSAVDHDGHILVDLVPELEFLIGKQPAVVELPPVETVTRFQTVFRKFVKVFAGAERPLIIFLDDLQWSDLGSLEILKILVTHLDLHHLFLIGAYRDNEVGPSHPVSLAIDAIHKAGGLVHELVLSPLSVDNLSRLIADALACETEQAAPLARLVHEKTDGNPYFSIQFLTALQEEELLKFVDGRWLWNVASIQEKAFTDNVIDLMLRKLRRLPDAARNGLMELACLGNSADISMLSTIFNRAEDEWDAEFGEAMRAGFVLRVRGTLKFIHDRVQEAANALIPAEDRAAVHLRIGRQMVSRLGEQAVEERIFDIVNQINRGVELITDDAEKDELRRLNFRAAMKAKASCAYASARNYLAQARSLLPENPWEVNYPDTFIIYLERAACESLVGNFEHADALFNLILGNVRTNLDSARVYSLRISQYQVAGRYGDAVTAALDALALFGIVCPAAEPDIDAVVESLRREVVDHLRGKDVGRLIDAPEVAVPEVQAILAILAEAMPCAYFARPHLYSWFILNALNLTLRSGNTAESCGAYMGYAILLAGVYDNVGLAFQFSELALRLQEKLNKPHLRGRLLCRHGLFVNSHRRPIATSVEIMEQAFLACQAYGDLAYAGYSALDAVWLTFEMGAPLETVLNVSSRYMAFAKLVRHEGLYQTLRAEERFVAELRDCAVVADPSADGSDGELDCLEVLTETKFGAGVAYFHLMNLIADFLAGRYEDALQQGARVAAYARSITGWFAENTYNFYNALSIAALFRTQSLDRQRALKKALAEHLEFLARQAETCPENYENRYTLVAAELARIENRDNTAMQLYERAISSARESGFVHQEAIASEVAARYFRDRASEIAAVAYLQNARDCYFLWGANTKSRQLSKSLSKVGARAGDIRPFLGRIEEMDLTTVVKASQAVSGEIVLGSLIETLLRIVVEHAGADRGLLILTSGDEQRIEAEARTERDQIKVVVHNTLVTPQDLPEPVLQFVVRTRERVLLDDAMSDQQFGANDYVRARRLRSVLCLPLVKQAKLIGVLYLENSLAAGVFTPNRIAVLELLASQAAISLENAIFYNEMENRVAERTDAMSREVAERSKAQARLDKIVTELDLILNNASLGICTIAKTSEGRTIQRANAALNQILGYEPGGLNGRDAQCLYDSVEDALTIATSYDSVLAVGQTYHGEHTLRHRDGHPVSVTMVGSAIDQNDLSQGAIWLVADVTEEHRIKAELMQAKEVAESANRAKSEFLAMISHEIRTPMNGILGMTQLVLDTKLTDQQRESLDVVKASGQALMTILNDVLDFSKMEAGALDLFIEDFSVPKVVQGVLTLMQTSAADKGITLAGLVSPQVPECLRGDQGRLRQVLMNLIANAVKFTERGGVTLSVERLWTEAAVKENGIGDTATIKFSVTDTGIGIGEGVRETLFQAFSQADRSISRRFGGTGLGLAICRKIVEQQGGTIGVESAPGRGSCFWFQLSFPIAEASAQPIVESDASGSVNPAPRALHVLVADDSAVNQRLVGAILEKRGHRVGIAKNGIEAVSLAVLEKFDAIIMDVHMPELDGLAATRRIRELEAKSGRHVPILALTAAAFQQDTEDCMAAGMDMVLLKPVAFDQLIAAVETHGARRVGAEAPAIAPAAPVEAPTLDEDRFDEVRLVLGDTAASEVVDAFVVTSAELLGVLSDPDQDCAVKCEAAHALKGASDMIGLAGLRALCFAIEMACRENRLADVADEFARLPDKVAEACRVLTDRMSVSPRRAR